MGNSPATPTADASAADTTQADTGDAATPTPEANGAAAGDASQTSEEAEAPEPLTTEALIEAVEWPEGIDDDTQKKIAEIFAAGDSPAEQVGKVLDLHKQALDAQSASLDDDWKTLQAEWVAGQKELYGAELDAKLSVGASVIERFASDPGAFREMLNMTGIGDNPEFISLMVNVGTALAEGKPVPTAETNVKTTLPPERRIYPNLS